MAPNGPYMLRWVCIGLGLANIALGAFFWVRGPSELLFFVPFLAGAAGFVLGILLGFETLARALCRHLGLKFPSFEPEQP